ncbi:MAG: hypothetical protein ACK5N8_08300 [Alphaproteobacteria bacterium]
MSDEEFGGCGCQSCSDNYGTYKEHPYESYEQRKQRRESEAAIEQFFKQRASFRAMEVLFKFGFFLVMAIFSFLLVMTCINGKTVERKAEGIVVSKIVKNSSGFTLLDVSGNAYPISSLKLFGGNKAVETTDLVNIFDGYVYSHNVSYDTVLKNAQPEWGTYLITFFFILVTIFSFFWFLSGPTEDNFKD